MAEPARGRIIECPNCGARNRLADAGVAGKSAVCGRCHQPLPAAISKTVTVTDSNFASVVERAPLPVLLDMWAAWCGPCRMIAPMIEQLATELAGKVLVGKLDVDANPQTASQFGVQSIPTLLILQNGREVDRIVGAQGKAAIFQRLQRFI